jgi:tRNA threonylcarbamoyl adenosine modification protein (Sua5/YciO/YrdC/YwlC family)
MIIKCAEAFNSLKSITQILENHGIVAIPTDTVYGLAVDGSDEEAIGKLFNAKHREERPFTLFMLKNDIERFAIPSKERIIDFFIPGPLTVVIKKKSNVLLPYISDKVGIRIPQHDLVLKLLAEYRRPIAVTSANKSGEPPMTSPYDIVEHFTEVDLVVDDGMLCSPPSTVLDLTVTPPVVMRKGAVPILAIEKVYGRIVMLNPSLKFNVLFVCSGNTCRSPMAEGMLKTLISSRYCEVRSAGTTAIGGLQSAHYARQVVKEYGGSIDRHRSNYLDRELVDWADLVLVMEFKHYETVLEINSDAVVKTFLLREYRRKTKYTEVPDPVGRDLIAYQKAAVKMYPVLKRVAKEIEARFKGAR